MNGPRNFADRGETTAGAAPGISRFVNGMGASGHFDAGAPLGGRVLLLLGLGLVLGWLGPYGTWQLDPVARFGFWLVGTPLIGVIAVLSARLVGRLEPAAHWPLPAQAAIGALIAGLPGVAIAAGLRSLLADAPDLSPAGLLRIYVSVAVVILMITLPMALIAVRQRPGATAALPETAASGSAFLRRLPEALGTDLLFIAGEDHYLRVTTDRGSTLILLRLSDALAELAPDAGQQVHRSYWVARRAVAAVEREDHRVTLRLVDGTRIPVSRTYLPALRRAGWLES